MKKLAQNRSNYGGVQSNLTTHRTKFSRSGLGGFALSELQCFFGGLALIEAAQQICGSRCPAMRVASWLTQARAPRTASARLFH